MRRGYIYRLNSTRYQSYNECNIESLVERATKALSFNRIKESLTKDDLDILLDAILYFLHWVEEIGILLIVIRKKIY